jgi:NAD(P)-binding Rossmann-like domain
MRNNISVLVVAIIASCCFHVCSLTKPHVAVVGAGFGGWGAAKALCENGCRVTLLDVIPDPTGATPYLTPTGATIKEQLSSIISSISDSTDALYYQSVASCCSLACILRKLNYQC